MGEIQNLVMNAYTGQFIGDIDKDGVHDIVNIHGGDPLGEPGNDIPPILLCYSYR